MRKKFDLGLIFSIVLAISSSGAVGMSNYLLYQSYNEDRELSKERMQQELSDRKKDRALEIERVNAELRSDWKKDVTEIVTNYMTALKSLREFNASLAYKDKWCDRFDYFKKNDAYIREQERKIIINGYKLAGMIDTNRDSHNTLNLLLIKLNTKRINNFTYLISKESGEKSRSDNYPTILKEIGSGGGEVQELLGKISGDMFFVFNKKG